MPLNTTLDAAQVGLAQCYKAEFDQAGAISAGAVADDFGITSCCLSEAE
jgi:hypothetical protein